GRAGIERRSEGAMSALPPAPHPTHEPPAGAAVMNRVRWLLFAGLTLLAIVSVSSWVAWRVSQSRIAASSARVARQGKAPLYYCPLPPSYTSDKPGECPICGMTLERMLSGEAPGAGTAEPGAGDVPGLAPVEIPAERTQLIGVRLARVERATLGQGSTLVGFVAPDETRLKRVQLRVAGWLQDVSDIRTGDVVRKGRPMLSLY